MQKRKGKITRPPGHTGRFLFVQSTTQKRTETTAAYPVEVEPEPEPEPVQLSQKEIIQRISDGIRQKQLQTTQKALHKIYKERREQQNA